ncbi:MAG TPA: Calx-beta domain-containing protein, partial [Pyrinomonadaceae bacterium]|nr:Calx-beta domain-containing protein [Pyrinomonadaceae bacterium]
FTVTDTFLETVTFTATVNGIPLSQHPTVQFVSRPAAAGSIVASPSTVNANGSDTTTITVTLQDANGNPSPNKLVNLSQGNGSSTISASTATTNAAGTVQFTAVNNVSQTVIYTAVDVTDGNLPVPGSAVVNFVNASGFCSNFNTYRFGTAAPGWAVSTFASSFPHDCFTGIGPIGLTFDASGNLLVGAAQNNGIYKFGSQGGIAGPATLLGTIPGSFGASLAGLTFAKDGKLYAMLGNGNNIVEVNPATAAVIRTVVHLSGGSRFALAIDPLSGDLFASGFDGIERISNYANGTGSITHYTTGDFDGIAFAPDGTLYAAAELQGTVYRISGTNAATPGTATLIANVPGNPDGIALEPNAANPAKPVLYVNRNDGTITRIDTSALPDTPVNPCGGPCTDIYSGGSRGDFVTVSPSGCLYATQSERVIRITKADGTCSLLPNSAAPQLALTPENVQPSPAQGATVTFTATLRNVASPANIPVSLFISGANPSLHLVNTDATGKAVFTYTGVATGTDRVFASADLGSSAISSNEAVVGWTAGKHSTFLTVNQSASSGTPNQPLTLTANLVDISILPPVPVSGATLTLALASQTCIATTNGAGTASCSVTPAVAPGSYPLNATFAATSTLLASSAKKTVNLIDAAPQPVVQFSAANYSVQEDCTALTITVNRVGDSSGAASVDYNTSDATATERKDYITALGTLQFGAGETSKTFAVLINEDSLVEGTETFKVNLGNPVGVALGPQATATITITDDPSEPATNAVDDPRTYVCQNYHDFLNRQPDPAGWDFWTNQITSCGSDAQCIEVRRINVSASFFLSIEFQQTGYLIERLYKTAYGDATGSSTFGGTHQLAVPTVRFTEFLADTQKIGEGVIVLQTGWEQVLENNKQAFTLAFAQRSRFTTAYPNSLTPAQFVDALNSKAGNVLSAGERTNAIALFGGAGDSSNIGARAQALRQVAEDQDLFNAEFNRAFVLMQYIGYLRRSPNDPQDSDYTGYDFWLTKLNQFNGNYINAEMVKAFLSSIEYRQRFGP